MRTALVAVAVVVSAVAGSSCKKKPTPAQEKFEAFVGMIAQRQQTVAQNLIIEGGKMTFDDSAGEPVEGTVAIFGNNLGAYEWHRTKLLKDEALPSGDHRVDIIVDVCMRPENAMGCSRPNTYELHGLVRNVGGQWMVAGSTCTETNNVR